MRQQLRKLLRLPRNMRRYDILLAAGGTGGHLYPAMSLAKILLAEKYAIAFVTTKNSVQSIKKEFPHCDVYRSPAGGVTGARMTRKILSLLKLSTGYVFNLAFIVWRAKLVAGFGGYASVATVLAAIHCKKLTLIHEQNAFMGRSNRFLCAHVTAVALSFHDTRGWKSSEQQLSAVVGTPLRSTFEIRNDYQTHNANQRFVLTILGGSQGASVFASLIPDALTQLPTVVQRQLFVFQQARKEQLTALHRRYRTLIIQTSLSEFFEDMPRLLSMSHLVISRAGASTIFELAMLRRPAILIPYPHAADNHQHYNAARFSDVGAGWLLDEQSTSAENLAQLVLRLYLSPNELNHASRCARRFTDANDASQKLFSLCTKLLS